MKRYFRVDVKGARMNKMVFEIEDLEITETEILGTVTSVFFDDEEYKGGFTTWAGRNLDNADLFESMINAYLRNDTSHGEVFGENWSIFDTLKIGVKEENGIEIELPYVSCGTIEKYELELATDNYRCYDHYDEFLVLENDGNILTDYECFYTTILFDELSAIQRGETKCLYINPELKEWVDSEEGQNEIDETLEEL